MTDNINALEQVLTQLRDENVIAGIDYEFALFIADLMPPEDPLDIDPVPMVAALLSARVSQQHVCLPLNSLQQPFEPWYSFPPVFALQALLEDDPRVASLNTDDTANKPLVWQHQRLYLQRYWQYECDLAARIAELTQIIPNPDPELIRSGLQQLFSEQDVGSTQHQAVALACLQRFCVVTGGPGTGKTTTVAKMMWLLQYVQQHTQQGQLRIKLVAPTGKAATRLSAAIQAVTRNLPPLDFPLPDECTTIHRLLGAIPNSPYFQHNQNNPAPVDLLIADEASMIDLPLLSKLLAAIPTGAKVILLGDSEQLASVAVGSVLADICNVAEGQGYGKSLADILEQILQRQVPRSDEARPINNSLVRLNRSYRFNPQSGIAQLARACNSGNAHQAIQVLQQPGDDSLLWYDSPDYQTLMQSCLPFFQGYFAAVAKADPAAVFNCLARQQILCAQRKGKWGVEAINQFISRQLKQHDFIDSQLEYYPGRCIMVLQNDPRLALFNGDVGVVLDDPEKEGGHRVWFQQQDGRFRSILPARLPPHESIYAMTIHKSQGSEYDHVILCLPEANSASKQQILTRELLYTGITRAQQRVSVFAAPQQIRRGVGGVSERASGLSVRLSYDD